MTINKSSLEERLFWINEKKKAIDFISKKSGIPKDTLSDWIRKYQEYGVKVLQPYRKIYFYTGETKQEALEDILFWGASKRSVIRKYNISSKSVLLAWLSNYNKRKELKSYSLVYTCT